MLLAGNVFAAEDGGENPFKVLASTVEEKARPLIQAASPAKDETPKKKHKKTHAEKISEERQEFFQKEQERKAKFLEKMRGAGLTDEQRQKKAVKFHAKELERKQKFAEKMNRKVLKNKRKQ